MNTIRHERWLLIPQDDGDCSQCIFRSGDGFDCIALHTWRKCVTHKRTKNAYISQFYHYINAPELPTNSRTL